MANVKIYSLPTCPHCNDAKAFLKEHGIKYTDINVEEDKAAQDEMVEKSGQRGTPTIDIDGEIIVGFDEDKLKEVLKIN
jgi:glutaredoxin 3